MFFIGYFNINVFIESYYHYALFYRRAYSLLLNALLQKQKNTCFRFYNHCGLHNS